MIITPAKVIVIPLLIAGILTTGAVIGAAQYGGLGDPSLEQVQTKSGRGNRLKKRATRETVSEKGRPAADLLAEELRGDQEMFDYLSYDTRDVRLDDTQMLKRLSLRMLAANRDLSRDHAARVAAYTAHRDRMKKLVDWTGHVDRDNTRTRVVGANKGDTDLAASYLKEAEEMLEQEKQHEPAKPSEESQPNVAQTKPAAAAKPAAADAKPAEATTTADEPTDEQVQFAQSRARFFNRLEIAKLAGAVEARDASPKNQALLKKLDRPLDLTMTHPTKLKDVLNHLRSVLMEPDGKTIPIYVDAKALEDVGVNLETSAPMDVDGLPLKMALRVLLRRLGLAYCVRDGVLIISSIQGIREELAEAASELLGSEPNALQGMYMGGMGGFMGGMGGGMGGMGGGMGGMGGIGGGMGAGMR